MLPVSENKNVLYNEIQDSGLKVVNTFESDTTLRYTVELGYRNNGEFNIGQIDFYESKRGTDEEIKFRGDEETLEAIFNRLETDFEVEDRKGSSYLSY